MCMGSLLNPLFKGRREIYEILCGLTAMHGYISIAKEETYKNYFKYRLLAQLEDMIPIQVLPLRLDVLVRPFNALSH